MNKYLLEIVVFICGGSLMILEIVASRILAPFVGTSTIVWTSIIGTIMAFLSLGYWYGGKIADKNASHKTLSKIILFSAFSVLMIILINLYFLSLLQQMNLSSYMTSIFASIFLFAIPSFLLGIVSPYSAKLKMNTLQTAGTTVGTLYAISTVGSIVGTFMAGFVLIPFLGTINILFVISLLLITASTLLSIKENLKLKTLLLFLIIINFTFSNQAISQAKNFHDIDTPYNRIWIYESTINGKQILQLKTDPFGIQSAMFLDNQYDLVFDYTKFYKLANHFNPNINNALMIGGAGYSFPKFFLKNNPNARLTVVEIDPGMTAIAKKYFALQIDNPNLNIIHEDARIFLNQNKIKFDTIFIDAFSSHLSIPHQLTTIETVKKIYEGLSDDGLVILNIISSFTGEKNLFLQAELKTYSEIFPYINLYQVNNNPSDTSQNIIMIASKTDILSDNQSEDEDISNMLKKVYTKKIEATLPILTDNYAPVDYYISKLHT